MGREVPAEARARAQQIFVWSSSALVPLLIHALNG